MANHKSPRQSATAQSVWDVVSVDEHAIEMQDRMGHSVTLPRSSFADAAVGNSLTMTMQPTEIAEQDHRKLAKELLQDLLQEG